MELALLPLSYYLQITLQGITLMTTYSSQREVDHRDAAVIKVYNTWFYTLLGKYGEEFMGPRIGEPRRKLPDFMAFLQ